MEALCFLFKPLPRILHTTASCYGGKYPMILNLTLGSQVRKLYAPSAFILMLATEKAGQGAE